MFKISFLIFFFFISHLVGQKKLKLEYEGEINYLTQTKNYLSFSTQNSPTENTIYLLEKAGNKIFEKQFNRVGEAIICENQEKVLISLYNPLDHGESYINKLYNINSGQEEIMPNLHTKLKLAKGGKYLYASGHLFDNASPLDIYNLETGEHFLIKQKNWARVASMSDNKLVILEQLSERNKKKQKYLKDKKGRRKAYFNESHLYKIKYKRGKISKERYLAIDDSLREKFVVENAKIPKIGTWTQLGTRMWVYDLDNKAFIFDTEIKDENNNIIILNRDDANYYSFTVDENDNIYIYGSKRSTNTRRKQEYIFLKYNDNFKLVWAQNVENYSSLERKEYMEIVNFVLKEKKTKEKKSLNKNTGKLEIYKQGDLTQKKTIRTMEIKKQNNLLFNQLNFNLKKKTVQ